MAITFSSGGVSRTPSSRSNCRAPLGQRSTTVVMASGSALSGCIQGRLSKSKPSGRPLTHSLAWMQRCRSNETLILSERYAFLATALLRLILRSHRLAGLLTYARWDPLSTGEPALIEPCLPPHVVQYVNVAHLHQLPSLFPGGFALLVYVQYITISARLSGSTFTASSMNSHGRLIAPGRWLLSQGGRESASMWTKWSLEPSWPSAPRGLSPWPRLAPLSLPLRPWRKTAAHRAASSTAARSVARSLGPSCRRPLTKKVGVALTPLSRPPLRSSRTRRAWTCSASSRSNRSR